MRNRPPQSLMTVPVSSARRLRALSLNCQIMIVLW
jgi:hypothetical protein